MNGPNPDCVAEVVAGLTNDHKRAIFELHGYYGIGPSHLVATLGWPVRYARFILGDLRREGVCNFGTLWDEDEGLCRGRGYWLDTFGKAVRARLEEAEAR